MIALPKAMKGSQIDSGISVNISINSHLVVVPAQHSQPFLLRAALGHASLRRIQGFPVRGHTHPGPTGDSAAAVEPPTNCHVWLRVPRQPGARTPNSSGNSGTHSHRAGGSTTDTRWAGGSTHT